MKLVFLKEAREDQLEATARYRKESKELARRFLDERTAVLKRIQQAPQQFPFVAERRQLAQMAVFPYKIVFEQTLDFTLIVAVAHASRRPDYWTDRTE